MTIGEHLCCEVDTHCRNLVRLLSLFEFIYKILGQVDIIKHGCKFVDSIVTALDFQLLKHQQLGILRDESFVKETIGQVLGVCLDEHVTPVQATEESDDGVEARVGFLIIKTLKTLLKLVIAIGSHIVGGQRALIHEILERYISVLLEADVI